MFSNDKFKITKKVSVRSRAPICGFTVNLCTMYKHEHCVLFEIAKIMCELTIVVHRGAFSTASRRE